MGILFSFLSSPLFRKRCVYVFDFLYPKLGISGSVGISLASRVMYIFCVFVSAVWSAGPVQVYLGTLVV